jgi:hypothetical protein
VEMKALQLGKLSWVLSIEIADQLLDKKKTYSFGFSGVQRETFVFVMVGLPARVSLLILGRFCI